MVCWWRYSLTVFLEILSSVKKTGFQRQYFLQILLSKNTVVTVFPFGIVFIWIISNISNIFVRLFVPYSWTSIPKLFGRPFQKNQTSIPQKFWKSIDQKPSKQSTKSLFCASSLSFFRYLFHLKITIAKSWSQNQNSRFIFWFYSSHLIYSGVSVILWGSANHFCY